ncbi:MAG: PAS domain-containing protein, partial [Lentisphaeria bacterium]
MSEGKFPTLEGYALSPTEDNMHWFLSRILIGRLLALGGVFLAVRFLQPEYVPGYALFICISLLTLIPYSIWVKRRRAILRNLSVQFLFDIFVVTGLIHFSGGVASPFFILYPLVILTSGFVVTGGLALKITILSSICYGLVLALETQGFLPYYGSDPTAYADVSKVFVTGTTRIFIFVFFGATSAYLSSFNAYQNRQIRSYASMVETVFDHIPAGIFGVLEDGTIAMANSAAGTLAGIQTDTLRGKQFSSLFVEEEETRQAQPESTLKEHLKPVESGTEPIPVLCICSKTTVPSGLFKGPQKDIMSAHNDSADTASSVMIWAVHDIT